MYNLPLQLKNLLPLLAIGFLLSGCASGPDLKSFEPPVYPPAPSDPRFVYERSLIGTIDVEPVTAKQRFKAMATGLPVGENVMVKPYDVAVHKGRVYVTDTIARSIVLFDIPGQKFVRFGVSGPGALRKPIGITVTDDGLVYVVDNTASRVIVYDAKGKYLAYFGSKDELKRPTDVAITANGLYAYVVDTGGVDNNHHHLVKYDLRTGKMLKKIGKRGSREGEFNFPIMVDIDSKGRIYVLDGGNFRVQRFTPDEQFDFSFGKVGNRFGQFSRPKGLAIDKDDNVYVMDASFSNFQIFNDKGELLLFVGERSFSNEPGKFSLPAGITVDEDGRVYAVDQVFAKVDVFRPYHLKKTDGYAGAKPVEE